MDLARIAYDAFHEGCGRSCHLQGKFDELLPDTKLAWVDAASAVEKEVRERMLEEERD